MTKQLIQARPLTGDRLMSEAEAGRVLNLADGSLPVMRARRSPNVPPHYRIGKRVMYRESDLITFLEARRVEPVSAA